MYKNREQDTPEGGPEDSKADFSGHEKIATLASKVMCRMSRALFEFKR